MLTLDEVANRGDVLDQIAGTVYARATVVVAQAMDPCGPEPYVYCLDADWPSTPAGRESELGIRLAIAQKDVAHSRAVAIELRTDLANAHKRVVELEAALAARPTLPAEHPCDECGKTFATLPAVRMHVARAHRGMQTTKQPEAAPTTEEAAQHKRPCPDCGREFSYPRSLQMHRLRVHGIMQSTKQAEDAPALPLPDADLVLPEAPAPEAPPEPPARPARPKLVPLPDDPSWRCASCGKGTQDGAFTRSLTRPELCLRCAGVVNSSPEQSAIAA